MGLPPVGALFNQTIQNTSKYYPSATISVRVVPEQQGPTFPWVNSLNYIISGNPLAFNLEENGY